MRDAFSDLGERLLAQHRSYRWAAYEQHLNDLLATTRRRAAAPFWAAAKLTKRLWKG
jgi:hypothetical protein